MRVSHVLVTLNILESSKKMAYCGFLIQRFTQAVVRIMKLFIRITIMTVMNFTHRNAT